MLAFPYACLTVEVSNETRYCINTLNNYFMIILFFVFEDEEISVCKQVYFPRLTQSSLGA